MKNTDKRVDAYIEWLVDAKSEETRQKRHETALKQLKEGKIRHWKYIKKYP